MKKIILLICVILSLQLAKSQEYDFAPKAVAKNNEPISESKIYTAVDKVAEFPGGINRFRKIFADGIDVKKLKATGNLQSTVQFVVEKDGRITDLKVTGNDENFNNAIKKSIKNIKDKWTPAKIRETSVRSIFRLPIKMIVE